MGRLAAEGACQALSLVRPQPHCFPLVHVTALVNSLHPSLKCSSRG